MNRRFASTISLVAAMCMTGLVCLTDECNAFVVSHTNDNKNVYTWRRSERYSFFQDLLKDAFANDDNLSSNKAEAQIGGPDDIFAPVAGSMLTDTQKRWRQANPKRVVGARGKIRAGNSICFWRVYRKEILQMICMEKEN